MKVLTYFSAPSAVTFVTVAATAFFSLVLSSLDCSTSASLVYCLASGVVLKVTFTFPVILSISTLVVPFAGENIPRSVTISAAFSLETVAAAVVAAFVAAVVAAVVSANAKEVVPMVAVSATVSASDKNFFLFISFSSSLS